MRARDDNDDDTAASALASEAEAVPDDLGTTMVASSVPATTATDYPATLSFTIPLPPPLDSFPPLSSFASPPPFGRPTRVEIPLWQCCPPRHYSLGTSISPKDASLRR